ncbi:DUF2891 domain-containing protein [Alterisphingorhabdus coralli]|uniref:DUF2891 domain-containing protein n=1 Tax=Alterisphingorhabdus coralli TaxID=3071408 RepID=A0AA97F606_9SPHN|nr:DUF2891 domain-containing protein [Parasphingorhabdus sp. SCSIO 66989]WOE74861.1 DUF2891 domain-containing protein [Parasphingorhabdus sp. SCSIO 66989]
MRISVLLAATALASLSLNACKRIDLEQQEAEAGTAAIPEPRADVLTDRFASFALACVHKQYPNKISHVLDSEADVAAPRDLYPAFYGCFDWHSSVHGHWLLVRILKTDPDSPGGEAMREAIITALDRSFTEDNIGGELAYYQGEDRGSFERPYGIAWYLQLVAELHESDEPKLREYRQTLAPLEDAIVAQIMQWLPKLAYPIRLGTHNQTAFAFGLMLDYARTVENSALEKALTDKALEFHKDDVNCPLAYEPSGEDFLSPCLMEADLMRRVMPQAEYSAWLSRFLPTIPTDGSANWLEPGVVRDASDGKLVHLDGVNLSRAWALEGIASALPDNDPRAAALTAAAKLHKETGIAAVSDEHYSGSHWLASFATYLETRRGL